MLRPCGNKGTRPKCPSFATRAGCDAFLRLWARRGLAIRILSQSSGRLLIYHTDMATVPASAVAPSSFTREYKANLVRALEAIDLDAVARAIEMIRKARDKNRH